MQNVSFNYSVQLIRDSPRARAGSELDVPISVRIALNANREAHSAAVLLGYSGAHLIRRSY
jgi:hypothetical protein